MDKALDEKYMSKAIELAKRGIGAVNPNPLVGAVIVKDDKIIAEGWHKKFGGPHAEVWALNEAGENAKGATIYVTLEPCSHQGKTPPCAKRIVEAGIKRCVIANFDSNPLVSGKGIEILKNAGIEVEVGILEKEAKEINKVFFKYIENKVPYLFLKCGITLDGKIATRSGNSKWITNEIAREKVQFLRTKFMGIMVGINTVLKDNPSLDSRLDTEKYTIEKRNPFRVVIDPNLESPIEAKFLNFNDGKAIIVTSTDNKNSEKIKKYENSGTRFIFLEGKIFKMKDILKELGKLEIDSVLLEGGSGLISTAFKENIIDAGEIFIAPKIIGDNSAIPFINGFNFDSMEEVFKLPNPKFNIYGDNISVEFENLWELSKNK